MPEILFSRLSALGLEALSAEVAENPDDFPFPLPRKRILRLLEVAATRFPDKSIEIMELYRDVLEGKVQ